MHQSASCKLIADIVPFSITELQFAVTGWLHSLGRWHCLQLCTSQQSNCFGQAGSKQQGSSLQRSGCTAADPHRTCGLDKYLSCCTFQPDIGFEP